MAISLARYWVTVRGDFTQFRRDVQQEGGRLARTSFGVSANLDLTSFRAQYRLFEAVYLRDRVIQVHASMNQSSWNIFLGSMNAAGGQAGSAMSGGILSSLMRLPMVLQGPLAVVAAGVAAIVGGAIGTAIVAAILLAVGGGALAAGIASAAQDPAVQSAWSAFGVRAKAEFVKMGEAFKAPLINAATTFREAMDKASPTVQRIVASMAPLVDKLAPAFADMALNSLPGIEAAVAASVPLFEVLAEHAPKVGTAISDFLSSIAKYGPEAAVILEDLFGFLEIALPVAAFLLGNLVVSYMVWTATVRLAVAAVTAAWDLLSGWFSKTVIPGFMIGLRLLGRFFTDFSGAVDETRARLQTIWQNSLNWFRNNFVAPIADLVVNKIPHAFRTGVDLIEFWWNRLKGIARAPVEFFINTVVNKGIVGTFNAVAKWVPGLGTVNEIHPAGFAAGGEFSGMVHGPPSTVDNRVARGPHGEPIGLATGEMVVNSRQTAKHRGLLHAINSGILGYADGGLIGAITNPAGWVKDRIGDLLGKIPGGGQMVKILAGLGTKMIAGLIELVKSKLSFGGDGGPSGPGPGFGSWPSSPSAQRGDSGVWRSIVALIRSTGPLSGSFGNAYRPGDPLWHGSGRAVDWMGYNQDALASFFMSIRGRVLELIHTTNSGGYYVTRGQRRASMGRQDALHRNHIHIAMAEGGLVPRVMDSGGILGPQQVAANTSGSRELMLPEGMKISLSDDTIRQIVQGFAVALNGGATALVQMGRSR